MVVGRLWGQGRQKMYSDCSDSAAFGLAAGKERLLVDCADAGAPIRGCHCFERLRRLPQTKEVANSPSG